MMFKKSMDELGRLPKEQALNSKKNSVIIILDDVRSMHNVGSIFRTCDAFAVNRLLLCGYTPVPPHRDIHKTALGATETVPWVHFESTFQAIEYARSNEYHVFAVEQAYGSISLERTEWGQEKIALVFGNEVTGVNEQIIQIADGCIEIPQWGSKHSLNISVCVGVVLWEMVRNKTSI